MKSARRRTPRDAAPPEVPEVSSKPVAPVVDEADPIPEHIRKMLEAAYTG